MPSYSFTADSAGQITLTGLTPAHEYDITATDMTKPPPPPPPETSTWGGYSAKNPRPADKPVGAATSPWNADASSTVLSNSASLVSALLSGINGPSNIGTLGRWSKPTYYAADTDPLVTLKFKAPSWGGTSVLDGKQIRIPKGAQPALPTWAEDGNTDAHMEIVLCKSDCERLGLAYGKSAQFWRAKWEGSVLRFESGSYGQIDGSLAGGKATAMNCDCCAGEIRAQELLANSIPHALFAVCSKSKIAKGFVVPAIHSDGGGGPIPMGQRFKLAYTPAEISATTWPAYRKAIIGAVAKKGLIIGDSSGNPFGLQVECSDMYTSLGVANPLASMPSSLDVVSGVDWKGRLRAVAP